MNYSRFANEEGVSIQHICEKSDKYETLGMSETKMKKKKNMYKYSHTLTAVCNGLSALTGNKERKICTYDKFMQSNCKRFNSTCEKLC